MELRVRTAVAAYVLLVVACAVGLCAQPQAATLPTATTHPAGGETQPAGVGAVVVGDGDDYLFAMVAPLTARLAGSGGPPVFLAVSLPPAEQALKVIGRLAGGPCLILRPAENSDRQQDWNWAGPKAVHLAVSSHPTSAALEIARRFWRRTDRLVAVCDDEPAMAVLGSALAAHLAVPFVPVRRTQEPGELSHAFAALGVREVLLASAGEQPRPTWQEGLAQTVTVLDVSGVQDRIVRTIGPQLVRNVILARAPNAGPQADRAVWLAPFLSLARRAPLVLCGGLDGQDAQDLVEEFVRSRGLSPRTITILGDYSAIALITVRDPRILETYEVEIEPCSGSGQSGPAAWGVGRIPYSRLSDASLMFAKGLLRPRAIEAATPTMLMVSNPQTQYGTLPLAETVSRATAEEHKNLGVRTAEFYHTPAHDPAVRRAAEEAHLIVYEGHLSDQFLFENPPPSEGPPGGGQGPAMVTTVPLAPLMADGGGPPPEADTQPGGESGPAGPSGGWLRDMSRFSKAGEPNDWTAPDAPEPRPESPPPTAISAAPVNLDARGLPLVVLQSCHSLEEGAALKAFRVGAVGMVGSVTNIHSASGSAFIKAYCDNILYRHATAGEALRDARNYFLCLARLKAARGHKQQAKVHRVALSFRLWGDPELEVFPPLAGQAVYRPISAALVAPGVVAVSVPRRHLPPAGTDKYLARIFPGAETAGIVGKAKGKTQRRLMPLYYFRLEAEEGFAERGYTRLSREGETDLRAVFLADAAGRFVHVLYLPEKETVGETFTLRFGR